jgi:hypothetical protein
VVTKAPTTKQQQTALKKYGLPWKDLNYSQRTYIRKNPTSISQSQMYPGMSLEPYLNKIKKLHLKGWTSVEILEANPNYGSDANVKKALESMKNGKAPVSISKAEMATRPTLAKTLNETFDTLKKKLNRAPYGEEILRETGISKRALYANLTSDRVLSEGRTITGGKKGLKASQKYFKEREIDKPTRVSRGAAGAQKDVSIKFKDANQEKQYLNFLKERFKYPKASTSNPITNEFLGKKFGISEDTVVATNSWLAKKNKLKYPVADPLHRGRVRASRLAEGKKYLGGERYADINKGQEIIRDQVNTYYKKYPKQILKNKKLIDALNLKLIDGKVVSKNKTAKELINAAQREKGILDIEHIKGVQTEARNIEWPINRQLAPYNVNSGFLQSVDAYLTKNLGSKDPTIQKNIANIEKTLKKFGWRINIDGQILGAKLIPAVNPAKQILPNILKNITSMGIKLPAALKVLGVGGAEGFAARTLESAKALYQNASKGAPIVKYLEKEIANCADGCFVKVANKNPERIAAKLASDPKIVNLMETGALTTGDKVPQPEKSILRDDFKETNLRWNNDVGAFVDTKTDNIASQAELKTWADDNPMEVKAGTSVKPGFLRKTGRALAHVGLPLPTAALDTYFIGRQIEEGRDPTDIAKDPFNWLGLATMEPLTKAAGMADKSGKLASVMRLGMSPGMIRGATRFLGLPGLAISTALTGYDQYKKYQNKEGFIYDLFNQEEIDNSRV